MKGPNGVPSRVWCRGIRSGSIRQVVEESQAAGHDEMVARMSVAHFSAASAG